MPYYCRNLILLICTLVLTAGCEKRHPDLPQDAPLLQQPSKVQVVEMPQEALPHWRSDAKQKSVLVLLSADSLLQPIPDELRKSARRLALSGSPQELRQHGPLRAETLLMPGQTLSAALDAKLFSRVIWVLPQGSPEERIDIDATRQGLISAGAIDENEAQSFKATKGGFSGQIKNIPFDAILSSHLPELVLDRAAIVHIDLTFFSSLYQNEIKTPIFPTIARSLAALRDSGIKTIEITLSLDSLFGQTPLDLRFVGNVIEEFFSEPKLLESPAPTKWEMRAKARYLDTFFQPEKMFDIYLKMLTEEPGTPSIHYALYQTLKLEKKMDDALGYLKKAAEGDPGYGQEYLLLAVDSYRKGNLAAAATFYRKGLEIFPENPLIKASLAKALNEGAKPEEASDLIKELLHLKWSESYYPNMKSYLANLQSKK